MLMLVPNGTDGVNDHSAQRNEDYRRLSSALGHLRKYTQCLLHGQTLPSSLTLHWDSWKGKGKSYFHLSLDIDIRKKIVDRI